LLAVALREVHGIEVGTSVLPIQVQHPTQLAQRALVANMFGGGRLKLGLGVNHAGMWRPPHNSFRKKPLKGVALPGAVPHINEKPDQLDNGPKPLIDALAARRVGMHREGIPVAGLACRRHPYGLGTIGLLTVSNMRWPWQHDQPPRIVE
jgi:hypothetical protein